MGVRVIHSCDACAAELDASLLLRWSFIDARGWLLADRWVCAVCAVRACKFIGLDAPVRPDRVPGPLAAGPGGSGLTRGASDAEKGVEVDTQPRDNSAVQVAACGDAIRCAVWCGAVCIGECVPR